MHRFHLLLLILGLGNAAYAAALYEFPDLIRRMPERMVTPGCAYKGERYLHGDEVATAEPCLNCTCVQAIVVCYLRVCPSATTPSPGCFLAREVGQCCPSLVCGGSENLKPKLPSSTIDLRPTFAPSQANTITTTSIESTITTLPPPTTTTTTEPVSLMFVTSTHPDDEIPSLNDIGINGGCLVNGTLYGDGSAMLSSSFCEYCFCIRGKTNCLKPKCDLVIEGCTPHYDSSFSCCPSRYDCFSKTLLMDPSTEITTATSTTKISSPQFSENFKHCIEGDRQYRHGEVIPDYRKCHNCICSNKSIICDEMKCSPPLEGCQPIIPEGHCCPVSYKCDYSDDANKYNIKGDNLNGKILDNGTKKSELKTVKQSEIFKIHPASNAEERPKSPGGSQELSGFFHNFVPIHRRLDEEIYELYNHPNNEFASSRVDIGSFTGPKNIGSQTVSFPTRENDKTLNLEAIESGTETTPTYTISKEELENVTMNSETVHDEKESLPTVSVGLPEVKTISIETLIYNFFVNNHVNSSDLETKETQELQRNNSKQQSSIVDALDLKITLPPLYRSTEFGSYKKVPTSTNEQSTFSTLSGSQGETFTESTINDRTMKTPQNLDSTLIYTTLYFTKDDATNDDSTPYIIKGTNDKHTFSPPLTNPSASTWHTTPASDTSSSGDTTKYDLTTAQAINSHVRINSKVPTSSYIDSDKNLNHDSRKPVLEDSLVNFYFPAEGRDAEENEDFMNVGSIHLGAPLSVEATELRKDPSNLRDKITESGGVIFMDPKYTDISPRLQSAENQSNSTEVNAKKEPSFDLKEHSIDRSDTEYTHNDRKKGPRIQDGYNQTNPGQDYKIIPFVAEDAIRGKFGIGNNTFAVQKDTTQGISDMVSDFCFIKGRIYMNGEMITKPDPCELCRCFYGQELCQLQRCPTPPPDCIPEKLPAFCCPRFTCGENTGSNERSPQAQKISLNNHARTPPIQLTTPHETFEEVQQPSQQPSGIQFGYRVRPRPPLITRLKDTTVSHDTTLMARLFTTTKPEFVKATVAQGPRFTTNQTPEVKKLPTSKVPDYNRISTTKQPEIIKTTITNSPLLSDPWGLLRVSGCNIYGKFFNINDQVEILSGPCSHCICTATGVECNDIC